MTDDQKPTSSETEPPLAVGEPPVEKTIDEPVQVDPAKEKDQPTSPPLNTPPPRKAPASFAMWWLLLILKLGVLASGYYLWQQHQALAHQQSLTEGLSARLAQQQDQWDGQSAQLTRSIQRELEQQATVQERELRALRQELATTSRRLLEISANSRENWKLAEAEYLLRLANQRLVVERNSSTALAMAEAADGLLRELNDTQLHSVRRALARDINALKMVEPVDVEGMYLRFAALIEQASNLSARGPMGEPFQPGEGLPPTSEGEDPAGWRDRVKASFSRLMAKLSQHLRVRTHGTPAVDAVLPPENQIYLTQNLRLMLEQAQAALLREEQNVYEASLTRAQDWLEQYYSLNPQAARLHAELAELQQQSISQVLPGIGESLALLRNYLEQRELSPSEPDRAEDDA